MGFWAQAKSFDWAKHFNSSYKKKIILLQCCSCKFTFSLNLWMKTWWVYSVQKTGGCSRECMHVVLFCCPQHESITCISALSSPYMINFLQVLRKSTLQSHHGSCNKNHFLHVFYLWCLLRLLVLRLCLLECELKHFKQILNLLMEKD